jgi:hypothetical protein
MIRPAPYPTRAVPPVNSESGQVRDVGSTIRGQVHFRNKNWTGFNDLSRNELHRNLNQVRTLSQSEEALKRMLGGSAKEARPEGMVPQAKPKRTKK